MAISGDDRRVNAYLNATTLSSTELAETYLGGENQIEVVGTLVKTLSQVFTVTLASPAVFTSVAHGRSNGDYLTLSTTGALYTGLTNGGSYYVINAATDTFKLSLTLGGTAINTSGTQSGVHTWSFIKATLRFADRPKYVGDNFYEGRATFQPTKRTIGELQTPTIQFSQMSVHLNNVDGFYNAYLPNGASYFSFIGARLTIQIGLRDVSGSFFNVFDGYIQDQGGFTIERQAIALNATDRFDILNTKTNFPVINATDFPAAPSDVLGKVIPCVLGDWTAGFDVTDGYSVLAVTGTIDTIDLSAPGNFYGGIIGYNVGGGYFVFSIGTYTPDNISNCYIKRGNDLMRTNFSATPSTNAGYYEVHVTSLYKTGSGPMTYTYQSGDLAIISDKIPYNATPSYNNIIEIAQSLLLNFTGFTSSDIDSTSWNALITKNTPASADMTSIKARLWVGDNNQTWLQLIRGLLEQVRVEIYVNSSSKIALKALHTDEFTAQASLNRIEQVEINEQTVAIAADETTFMNQAQINYAFTPVTNKTMRTTIQRKNGVSITGSGKTVIKGIDCPNLYVDTDANNQLDEFIRLYSTGLFYVQVEVAWVHLLKDLGQFVGFNYSVGSVDFNNAPMIIRDFGINLQTASVVLRLLSLANFIYTGYTPSNDGNFLSGASQTISNA